MEGIGGGRIGRVRLEIIILVVLVVGKVSVGFGDGFWKLDALSGCRQDLKDVIFTARTRRTPKAFMPRAMSIGIHTFLFMSKELIGGPRRDVAKMIDCA